MGTPSGTTHQYSSEIDKLKAKLRAYEEALNTVRDGAVTLNPEGIILYCNSCFAALLKQPPQDLIGTSVFAVLASPGDRQKFTELLIDETRENSRTELYLRSSDGTILPVNVSASRLRIENAFNLCMVVTDLTEHKQFLKTNAELERSRRMSDIGRLSTTIAHEIRNPLAAIKIAAYNIRRKAKNPMLDKHIDTINNKVIESDHIINNLLGFSRIKSACYEPVKLRGLLKDCIGTVMIKYVDWNVELKQCLSCGKDDIIEADFTQLKMLLNNILDNAYQALIGQTGAITIAACRNRSGAWEISVTDNGVGIDKDSMGKIFDPFYTTKSKGIGLGLPVCREITELHGGRIEVKSATGKGTTFTVTLPARRNGLGAPA